MILVFHLLDLVLEGLFLVDLKIESVLSELGRGLLQTPLDLVVLLSLPYHLQILLFLLHLLLYLPLNLMIEHAG